VFGLLIGKSFSALGTACSSPARAGGLHLGAPGCLGWAVALVGDLECPWDQADSHRLAAAPAQHGASGLGCGGRDDDVQQHELHAA